MSFEIDAQAFVQLAALSDWWDEGDDGPEAAVLFHLLDSFQCGVECGDGGLKVQWSRKFERVSCTRRGRRNDSQPPSTTPS